MLLSAPPLLATAVMTPALVCRQKRPLAESEARASSAHPMDLVDAPVPYWAQRTRSVGFRSTLQFVFCVKLTSSRERDRELLATVFPTSRTAPEIVATCESGGSMPPMPLRVASFGMPQHPAPNDQQESTAVRLTRERKSSRMVIVVSIVPMPGSIGPEIVTCVSKSIRPYCS